MRKLLLLAVIFFPSTLLFSQSDSLLKDFKFRNANYRAVNFSLNGGTQYLNTKFVTGESESRSSSATIGAVYQNWKSTDKILFNFSGGLFVSYFNGNNDNVGDETKGRWYSLSPNFSLNNKWFSNKSFLELGADGSANFSNAKYSIEPPYSEQKQKEGSQSLSITGGIGKGRLENITDMQNALWLVKALEKEGRFSRALSGNELLELGKAITTANSTRVLDSRKRIQFILETIDQYFQQKDLINKTDIRYFSNLNDVAFYAINDFRLAGKELYIRVTPSLFNFDGDFRQEPNITSTKEDAFNYAVLLSAGINNHVPVSLKHQNDIGISIQLKQVNTDYSERHITSSTVNTLDMEGQLFQAGLQGYFQHAIYPNTRTIIKFRLEALGGYQGLEEESSWYHNEKLLASCDYFISYRTRFQVNLGGRYQNNIYDVTKYIQRLPRNFDLFGIAGLFVSL